jgi:hypothetical protein
MLAAGCDDAGLCAPTGEGRSWILATTYVVVVFSIALQAGSMDLLRRFSVADKSQELSTDFNFGCHSSGQMDGFIRLNRSSVFGYDTRVNMAMRTHCEHYCVSVTRIGFEPLSLIPETANNSVHFSTGLLC